MINEFANARYVQLEEEIDLFNEMGISSVKKVTGILNGVKSALDDLRKEINKSTFTDAEEEIHFFKYIKPKFVACHLYALEKFKIEADKPLGNDDLLESYYRQELKYIKRFNEKYRFLHQYYLLDGKELDRNYFLRGPNKTDIFISEIPDLDQEFSTPGEYMFAKFITMERLQDYLMKCLYPAEEAVNVFGGSKQKKNLHWTGNAINLVEIAYGIWLTRQINHGDATITDIFESLEQAFQIKVGPPFRRWQEIAQRKMISSTKYIDQIKAEILQRINDGNK